MEYPRQTNNLIATLRGLPEDHSLAKLRPAYALGNLIEVLEEKYKFGQVKVGEEIAHRCSPQKVVSGAILRVQVANPTLRSELEFKKQKILDQIHRLPGGGIIKAINFSHG